MLNMASGKAWIPSHGLAVSKGLKFLKFHEGSFFICYDMSNHILDYSDDF